MAAKTTSTVDNSPEQVASVKNEPEKTLFSWKAPVRPFKRRDREFWTTVIVIAAIFGLILLLIEGVMPVILIISVVFLYYVLSTVPPEDTDYALTNKGVKIEDKITPWDILPRYWFSKRYSSKLLIFEMTAIPGRLELVIHEKDKPNLKKHLKEYIVEEEVPPSTLDKTANWLSERFPKK